MLHSKVDSMDFRLSNLEGNVNKIQVTVQEMYVDQQLLKEDVYTQ